MSNQGSSSKLAQSNTKYSQTLIIRTSIIQTFFSGPNFFMNIN